MSRRFCGLYRTFLNMFYNYHEVSYLVVLFYACLSIYVVVMVG